MRLGKYIKAAFTNRWNLLAFLGGLGFAALSGAVDVLGPLVLAAEVGYLALLGTHPKFQRYVEAQEAKTKRDESFQSVDQTLRRIMRSLPKESLQRFGALRARCIELRRIALDLKQPGGDTNDGTGLDQFQLAGLDRLLWIFLKLMYTEYSLSRFFKQTSEQKIRGEIVRLNERIRKVSQTDPTPHSERIRETLQDNLQTCHDRIANYQKAKENYELVQLEIERLDNKIRSLSEVAVNRQEPDFISGQVDQVAESMLNTERTINELQFATGFRSVDDEVPELVQREAVDVLQ